MENKMEDLKMDGGTENLFVKMKEIQNEAESDSSEDSDTIDLEKTEDQMADPPKPRRKRFVPKYEVDGVAKIIIGDETQAAVEILIGPDVNSQHPWKEVQKNVILENIESLKENSEFFPLTDEIESYEEEYILIGYNVDESKDYDEFYICYTKEARDHCKQQSDKFHRRQQKKLEKAIFKAPKPWITYGSAQEITELIPIYTRPLIQVEIKTKFPTVYQPENFKARDSNGVRDGYIELTPYRVKYNNVYKTRIDAASQIAPPLVNAYAQTVLRYPKNMWTQSVTDALGKISLEKENVTEGGGGGDGVPQDDEDDDDDESEVESEKEEEEVDVSIEAYKAALLRMRRPSAVNRLTTFINDNKTEIESIIELNTVMDMYSNDYPDLSRTEVFDEYDTMTFDQYICFSDVRAKNKYISAAMFHPMCTGVVAIAYSTGSPVVMESSTQNEDPIQKMVYSLNPVMIWSHTDTLMPKLYLETMREVKVLSFCPFDENILVGGCMNGQVILWDLTNKLSEVEHFEVLSETREKYRTAINSQMQWMKGVSAKSIVPPTAVTLLLHSHHGPILSLQWLPPTHTVSTTGRRTRIDDLSASLSKMFISGSEDGTILIWSLSIENVMATMEGKKIKKSKRIFKRPSALTVGISPLKILDRNWQPVYRVISGVAGQPETIPPQSFDGSKPAVEYYDLAKNDGSGRKYFGCNVIDEGEPPIRMYCGSIYGEVINMFWEGHDFNTGEVVNSEFCDISFRTSLHDGPVTTTLQSPFLKEIFITVGGSLFALWSDKISGQPLLWKKRNSVLTDARWSNYKPSIIFITTALGHLETWDLLLKSDGPIAVQTLSGSMITNITLHCLPIVKNIIGVSDANGSFRMFTNPPVFMLESAAYIERTKLTMKRETNLRTKFQEFQNNFAEKNAELLIEERQMELERLAEKEALEKKQLEEDEQRRQEQEEARRLLAQRKITPEERWQEIINKLIERTIAVKKRINRQELLAQEKPLREIEFQRLEKEKKMLEVMKNQKTIFNEIVAIWFPEALEQKKEVDKVLTVSERITLGTKYMTEYDNMENSAKETVKNNPYHYKFQWETTLTEGKERALSLNRNAAFIMLHKSRLLKDYSDSSQTRGMTETESVISEVTTSLFSEEVFGGTQGGG